jgi:expansin (peptidoglycan-binding protein)
LIAVVGVVVWVTRPDPASCDATHTVADSGTSSRLPLPARSSGIVNRHTVDASVPAKPGEARFYAFGPEVSCSIPGLSLDGFYGGVSTEEYGHADLCGAYLDVYGPRGDVRVLIADRCPGCGPGQLDLSTAAFEQIADRSDGVAQVRYTVVRDPNPPPELSYEIKPDASADWFAMLVTGSGNPIQRVAIRHATGGRWQELNRGMDNYWTLTGAGQGPFAARVTDVLGHQVEVSGISLAPGQRFTGSRLYTVEQAGGSTMVEALTTAPTPPAPTQPRQTEGQVSGCKL